MTGPLPDRLLERWRKSGWTDPGDRVVVALSGGIDSLVLLHLLRFHLGELGLNVEAAHFDHRMRAGSAADAAWVRGVATSWDVPLQVGAAANAPADEATARRLRYDFLLDLLRERGGRWIVTAHHADDQVETILFRMARGTGVEGLRGMRTARAPGVLRPLLSFPKAAIEEYATEAGLRPRTDPTNVLLHHARNRIRHQVLPALERVHPGARRGILRLGRNAGHAASALRTLLAPLVDAVVIERGAHRIVLDRDRFLLHPPEVRRVLLRAVAREAGTVTTAAGTEVALEFISTGSSGAQISLPGPIRLVREFDRIRLEHGEAPDATAPSAIPIEAPGRGAAVWDPDGQGLPVRWGWDALPGASAVFDPDALIMPVELREWRPGDRITTAVGTRKVKKLLGELRIPAEERSSTPLLVDGEGTVLWVPAGARSVHALPETDSKRWHIGVGNDRDI